MKIAWVNPGFSDYRVPVYGELDSLTRGGLHVIYSLERTPARASNKLKARLGTRALGLPGETRIDWGGGRESFANKSFRFAYQRGLYRAIARVRPDVLIGEGFFQWTPAAVAYKVARRVPLVIAYERTAHTERHAGRLRIFYRKCIARITDAFACNGRLSKEFCVRILGACEKRVITGAMSADTELLSDLSAQHTSNNRQSLAMNLGVTHPVFLFAGRLIRLKGVPELLAAWREFSHQSGGSGSLMLIGDGPERAELEHLAQDLPHVVFRGAVPYEKMVDYYSLADVFVMPSLEDNWSLVVPEAMACGKPILCSLYNGCWPELIREGINGWTFDPKDSMHLAELFQWFVNNQGAMGRMGAASREIVQEFTPQKAAQAVLKACEIACDPSVHP